MPLLQLVCPHCDTTVQMNATSVTRSRECPECSRVIILQFTTKETKVKRKALLMPMHALEGEDTAGDILLPKSLEGDVRSRMLHDPEVKTSARRLVWGLAMVIFLIGVVVAGNAFNWWTGAAEGIENLAAKVTAPKAGLDEAPPPSVPANTEKIQPALREPVEPEIFAEAAAAEPASPASAALSPEKVGEQDLAMRAVQAFLNATNVEERLKVCRDRSLMEAKIRQYYEEKPAGPIAHESITASGDAASGYTYIFKVRLASGDERQVTVGKTVSGDYLVDWASFVLYGEMDWKEFMEEKPVSAVLLRVLAVVGDHFTGEFSDPGRYGCVKLMDPRSRDAPPIFAYYSKSTTLGREMDFVMRQSLSQEVPLILALKYPSENAPENQVLVDERVAEGWVARGR